MDRKQWKINRPEDQQWNKWMEWKEWKWMEGRKGMEMEYGRI